jgi:hypothetical protein
MMLPVAEQLALVTEDLTDLDTLLPRLAQEAAAAGAVIMMPPLITVWSTAEANPGNGRAAQSAAVGAAKAPL